MTIYGPPQETDRVRRRTPAKINEKIDHATAQRVEDLATRGRADIAQRLEALDREWSVQRVFHLGTSLAGLTGVALAAAGLRRGGLALTAIAAGFSLHYALSGWTPALSLMRRLKIRTRREIDAEKFALKSVRGDFDAVCTAQSSIARAGNALQAIWR